MSRGNLQGLLAEFETAGGIVEAARQAYAKGYRRLDAFTPYPIEELQDALHLHKTRVPLVVLCGGLFGMAFGWGLQYYTAVVDYPLNIGGRPVYAWPAFVVPTFETTVLFSAFAALFGMLALNGLPQPYHPAFNVPEFARASRDRFFLLIDSDDAHFELDGTRALLRGLGAARVTEVEP